MVKEPGEPQVTMALTPEGVSLSIHTLLRGDGTDWDRDLLGAWVLERYEKARVVAEVNAAYGLTSPSIRIEPVEIVKALPVQRADPEKKRLEELIQKSVENGSVLPIQSTPRMPVSEWRTRVMERLSSSPGLPPSKFKDIDPAISSNGVQQRLYRMRAMGMVVFRHTDGPPSRGKWFAKEPEMEEDQYHVDIITEVLSYTRGKVFLMLGGHPNQDSKRQLERQLSLSELRWPELDESDPIDWWLKEIRKPDIDLVMINKFNRHRASQFMHVAQDEGKPFLYLLHGYGVRTVAAELNKQVLQGRLALQAAA